MRQYLVLCAIVCLAFSGCASNMLMGCKSCGQQPCHVTRTQMAPRPQICRTACRPEGFKLGGLKKCSTDCCESDCCCEDDYCCEADCGCCDECTGPDCGCCDDCCCSDDCCYASDDCCDDGGCFGNGQCRNGLCNACGGRGCRMCCRAMGCNPHSVGYPEQYNFNPGPPTGQVGYPYYTVRGPRDFLRNNPPTIGPY